METVRLKWAGASSVETPVMVMPLWGKKGKQEEDQSFSYEIFGGATITEEGGRYEVSWKSPMVTTVTVSSPPEIGEGVKHSRQGSTVRIEAGECRLRVLKRGGETLAFISKM